MPLLARTVLLRISLLIMTFVAAAQGDVALAEPPDRVHAVVPALRCRRRRSRSPARRWWVTRSAPADPATARASSRRALAWGLGSGLAMAVLLLALRPAYIPIFTTDPEVRDLVWSLVVVVAASQPIGALLYVLDGILIGAGDTRYLAWTMLVALLTFLPLAGAVLVTDAGVVALWWALTGWLLARQVAVALRYRSAAWLRPGPAA